MEEMGEVEEEGRSEEIGENVACLKGLPLDVSGVDGGPTGSMD